QVLPWYQFEAGEWHQGRFPLWDPHHWGGQSLIGQALPGAAYPLNWILFLLPLRKGWIRQPYLHWYFVLIHYMGALFCYWRCLDLLLDAGANASPQDSRSGLPLWTLPDPYQRIADIADLRVRQDRAPLGQRARPGRLGSGGALLRPSRFFARAAVDSRYRYP